MVLIINMVIEANLQEYTDPALYDRENADFEPDGPFFLALAQQLAGRVLELGCGTGRITIPLAQAGIPITGLDLMPPMLARAKEKAAGLPIEWAIEWVHGDVRTFDLGRQFSLIFESGALFQHLLETADQEAMLARVRARLEPDGRFVIGSLFPTCPTWNLTRKKSSGLAMRMRPAAQSRFPAPNITTSYAKSRPRPPIAAGKKQTAAKSNESPPSNCGIPSPRKWSYYYSTVA